MIYEYLTKKPVIYPKLMGQDLDIPLDTVYKILVVHWTRFKNPQVYDDRIITDYPRNRWYYEVTDTVYERGKHVPISQLEEYCLSNQRHDQHISMFAHDERWVRNFLETGSVSCGETDLYAPFMWIEMDRKDYYGNADLNKALLDAYVVESNLNKMYPNTAHVFTSGNNSSHLIVDMSLFGRPIVSKNNVKAFYRLALKLVGDVRHGNGILNPSDLSTVSLSELLDIANVDRNKAIASLENLDPHVYSANALIRQPWSYHEKSNRQKKIVGKPPHTLHFDYSERPELLKMWFDNFDDPKRKRKSSVDFKYDSSYILKKIKEKFPDIEDYPPNGEGWIRGLYNPFYHDTNPSCAVNIYTGRIHDFGSIEYSMSFDEYLTYL